MSVGAVNKQTGERIPTAGMPAIDDALDLTSVNPVQNAIITAALADKQDKTDNNLQTTDKTVVGAINEHEGDIGSLKSGFTNLDVALSVPDGTGKNLWTNDVYKYSTAINSSGNEYSVDAYNLYKIPVKDNTDYVLSLTDTESVSSSQSYRIQFLDASDNALGLESGTYGNIRPSKPFTTPSGTVQVKVSVRKLSEDIQLELGSTATEYTPYIPSVESRIEAVETQTSITATKDNTNIIDVYLASCVKKGGVAYVYLVIGTNAMQADATLFTLDVTAKNSAFAIVIDNNGAISGEVYISKDSNVIKALYPISKATSRFYLFFPCN